MKTLKTIYIFVALLLLVSGPTVLLAQDPLTPIPLCTPEPCLGDTWHTDVIQVTTMPGVPPGCIFHVGYTWRMCNGVMEINGFNFTYDDADPDCQTLRDSIYNNPTNRVNFLHNFYAAMPAAIARQLFMNFYNNPWRTPGDGDCPNSKKHYDINVGSCISFYLYKFGTVQFPIYWLQPYGCSGICCKWSYDVCYNTVTHQYEYTETRTGSQADCNATGTELPGSPYEVLHTPCMPFCTDGHGDE